MFLCVCYSAELININFKDLSIEDLITITSKRIGKNILMTEKIEGKVDFISNSPIDENSLLDILKYSLKPRGYELVENNNILRVVKKNKIENRDKKIKKTVKKFVKKEIPQDKKIVKEDIYNDLIYLENNEASNVGKILDSIISKKSYENQIKPIISIDEKTNSLIIDGTLKQIENLKKLIKKLDIQKEQVYIKALIVELDNDLIEDIGINLEYWVEKVIQVVYTLFHQI